MNLRRIVWLSITLFILFFFFALMPVDVFDAYPVSLGFLAGGLFFIALAQTLADFGSIYELLEAPDPNEPKPLGRKLFPYAFIPGFLLILILIVYHSNQKEKELKQFGLLTKGIVINGSSTTTTRKLQSNTSYDLIVAYYDTVGHQHNIHQTVSSFEFNSAYKGAKIDVVYSKKHPNLAEAIMSIDKLATYTTIPNKKITIDHLIAILKSNQEDTILSYLNSLSYQWTKENDGVYSNKKREIAVKIFPDNSEVAYIETGSTSYMSKSTDKESFEGSLVSRGYKKKAVTEDNKTYEVYYNDKYTISKERKLSEPNANQLGISVYTVYHIFASR